MKKKLFILTSVLMMVLLSSSALFISCDDDHFTVDSQVSGKGTLWQNISSNPDLSEFASIFSKVYYSTTEEKTTRQTYA